MRSLPVVLSSNAALTTERENLWIVSRPYKNFRLLRMDVRNNQVVARIPVGQLWRIDARRIVPR